MQRRRQTAKCDAPRRQRVKASENTFLLTRPPRLHDRGGRLERKTTLWVEIPRKKLRLLRHGRDLDVLEAQIGGWVVSLKTDDALVVFPPLTGAGRRLRVVGEVRGLVAVHPRCVVVPHRDDRHREPFLVARHHLAAWLP